MAKRSAASRFTIFARASALLGACDQPKQEVASDQYAWEAGYLDIHHINRGRGNATFMIFPDGTNLLYDDEDGWVAIDAETDQLSKNLS